MADYLVIVESPAKAKTIGKFLGNSYKIEASMGHVRDLPKSQIGIDVEKNFEPKYITIRGKGDLISKLKKEAKGAKKVFLATDPDREGEAISWHLANILNLEKGKYSRITFNEITKNAVKNAINAPREIDMDLVDAQQARRVLDRIVGYKISPLLWKKVRKGLSAGRVQSVSTKLICEREEEIKNFVEEEYWTISAFLNSKNSKIVFEAKLYGKGTEKLELKNKEQVDGILEAIEGKEFIVLKIKKSEKKRSPAPPFVTSTMQQEASRKLGFTSKKTMMLAQQLYEGIEVKGVGAVGLVTYIRTDSMRVSSEAQAETIDFIKARYGEKYAPETPRTYKNKSASQDAHEAIRPTYISYEPEEIRESLSNDQYKLYKLIWERYVSSQMSNAVYDTISADIGCGEYLFKANGSKVKFKGFMAVYIEGKDEETEDKDQSLPLMEVDEKLDLKKLDPKQHFTQPPQRYTEATLIKALEEKGIGRPSTYSPTISTILARGYVIKEKKYLIPTELGIVVTEIMKKHFSDIVNVEFTANMEQKLDDVEEGKKIWVEIIREFYKPFVDTIKQAEDEIGHVELKDEVTDIKCEKCGRNMVIKHGRFGKFLACPGFPECRNARPIVEETGVNCPLCGGKVLVKKSRKGKKYFGCENNPKCGFMTWDQPLQESCPKCGSFLVKKFTGRKATIKCINENCDFVKEGNEVKK